MACEISDCVGILTVMQVIIHLKCGNLGQSANSLLYALCTRILIGLCRSVDCRSVAIATVRICMLLYV